MEDNNKTTAVAIQKAEEASLEVIRYKEELAKQMGLPSSYQMGLLKEVCRDLIESGFAPTCFKQNPLALYLCALRGRELGIGPVEAIMETFWVAPGNKIGMYANRMLALLHKHGVTSKFLTETKDACRILFTPPSPHEPYEAFFQFEEARVAGLVKPDSNWFKWPLDMNRSRAISRGWRALAGTFAGTGANLYTPEELAEVTEAEESKADATPPPDVVIGTRKKTETGMAASAVTTGSVTVEAAPAKTETQKPDRAIADTETITLRKIPTDDAVHVAPAPKKAEAPKPEPMAAAPPASPDRDLTVEKPAPKPQTQPTARDRLVALYPAMPSEQAGERMEIAHAYLSGWFGINKPEQWPKNAVDRHQALDALEKAAAENRDKLTSVDQAWQTGKAHREHAEGDDSTPYYDKLKWGGDTRLAAKALKRKFGQTAEDFVDLVEYFKLDRLPEEDAAAFMQVAIAAGRGTDILKNLRKVSEALEDSYSSIVGSIERYRSQPITEVPAADIATYIKRVQARIDADQEPSRINTETAAKA